MTDAFWQFVIAPLAVAAGGLLTLWWQARSARTEKFDEQGIAKATDDLSELRKYRAQIDEELSRCRTSEQSLRIDMGIISSKSAALESRVSALGADLVDALERIKNLETERAELQVSMEVIRVDRDAIRTQLELLQSAQEKEAALRKAGALRTRRTDRAE